MRIGIIQCDSVPEALANEFTSYSDMLIQAFNRLNHTLVYTIYDVTKGHFPRELDECDAYVTTGSRNSVQDEQAWITRLEEMVQRCQQGQKKLVGICFGHQLLAKALGGRVGKNEQGLGAGVIRSHLLSREPWMQPFQQTVDLNVYHQEQVLQAPKGARRLASNQVCKNFALQFDDYLLGIQGHPEFDKLFTRRLMEIWADTIPTEILREARRSLSNDPDNALVIQWIARFLGVPCLGN